MGYTMPSIIESYGMHNVYIYVYVYIYIYIYRYTYIYIHIHPGAWFTARVFCHVLQSLYDDLHVYIMVFAGLVKQSSSFLVTKCGKFHCVLFFHHFSLVFACFCERQE